MPKDDFIKCATCGEYFDPANLGAVFEHEHAGLPQPEWSGSKQIVDSEQVRRLDAMLSQRPIEPQE